MIICDLCKKEMKKQFIQISIRDEIFRMRLYNLGFETTFFDLCSIKCVLEFINQLRIIPLEVSGNTNL